MVVAAANAGLWRHLGMGLGPIFKHHHRPALAADADARCEYALREMQCLHSVCLIFSDTNPELREFLRARNPKQQHSATLESYLIKPIQRILKYPLLLQQLKYLTDPHTDEHHHLSGKNFLPFVLCKKYITNKN